MDRHCVYYIHKHKYLLGIVLCNVVQPYVAISTDTFLLLPFLGPSLLRYLPLYHIQKDIGSNFVSGT